MKHNLLSFVLIILASLSSVTVWGADYESTLTSAGLSTGATVTTTNACDATATCYQTSNSTGYLIITFSPNLSLSNGDKITVNWCPNSSSNRTPKYSINGASAVNMTTAKGYSDVDYEINITSSTTLSTLKLQGAGSSGIQFKKITIGSSSKTIYLNLNDFTDWENSGAKFRIWDGANNINMTKVDDDCGHIYKVEVGNSITDIYFKRSKADYSTDWNEVHISDIGTNDMVTVTGWTAGTLGTYPPTLKVTYDANGGSGSMAEETGITCGDDVTLKSNTFSNAGLAFLGWNTKNDGSGTAYADGAAITVSGGNIKLYARWGTVYSFHYGIDGSETREDFIEKGMPHERQINDFVLPNTLDLTQIFWVGKNGTFCSSNLATEATLHHYDKSEKMRFNDLKFAKVIEPGDCAPAAPRFIGHNNNVAGVIGTIRIIDNSDYANVQASFMPNGFAMLYGDAGSLNNTLAFVNHHDLPNIWKSNPIYMSSDYSGTGKKFYIGLLKSDDTYAYCDMSEEADLPSIITAADGTYGRFRITEKTCQKNFECEFVPTYRIIYHSNYAGGPVDTHSEDVMQDENITLHLASAPTAPSGHTFAGWNAHADGTYNSSERLAVGSNYDLNHPSADVELYAQWEENDSPCFEMKDITASASKNLTTPVTTGATIIGGKVYALDALGYDDTKKWELGSSSDSIRVELDYPLAIGSVVSVTYTTGGTEGRGIKMADAYKNAEHVHSFTNSANVTNHEDSYTITSDDGFAGLDVLWFCRATSNKTYLSNITVSGCASCKYTKLKYAETSIEKTIGDATFTNTLTNPNTLSISYTSTNTSVATVDGTGAVTIVGVGTTTIKATSAEQTVGGYDYCADEVSYTLTVSEGPCFSIVASDADGNVSQDASLTTGGAAIALGGDATYVRQDGSSLTIEAVRGIKIDNQKDIIKVTMPTGSCLGIGTVIKVSGYVSSSGRGIGIYTTNAGQQIKMVKTSTSGNYDLSYTLQAGDPWLDAEVFYIQRISGCTYLKTLTITNCGTPCTEAIPMISTTDPTTKCPGASVTMTCTGAEAGATRQWYKDGAAIGGATYISYSTTEPGEYTCIASKMCSRTSNPIKIVNKDMAMVHSVYDSYYIKQGRVSPPIPLFEVPGVSSWSITPAITGCTYEKEGDIIYLKGVPTGIDANRDETLTLTYDLGCGGANATMLLHELAATPKPTVAYIVVGTKNGGFTDGIVASQSTGHSLYQYIEDHGYTLTACNEYSTVDEKDIVEYYTQYDIVLITDYPSTKETTGGKSYGNALGVLVDKVPILSLETFLSGNSNWSKVGLSANPHTPQDAGGENDDQFTMDLLCPAHDIFRGSIVKTDNKINVITSFGTDDGDKNTTGLQGFTSMEAPDGFIFIATINGGKHGTLVTCCERQTVVEARLLLFGVNYYGSESMTADGKLAVKQMLDYLLKKEKSQVADCAEVFDNGLNNDGGTRQTTISSVTYTSGDNLWSNPANWTDGHLPNALKAVLVEQPCIVDVPSAHASSIKLCKGSNEQGTACDGKLTIRPNGGLAVSSSIVKVNGTDHVNTLDIAATDLIIEANVTNQGALALGTKGQGTPATVQYYSKAIQSATASTWQYMGVPFSEMNHAVDYFRGAWMCEWLEGIPAGAAGANWAYITNDDVLNPFQGYAITQPAAKTYTHTGMLLSADTRVIDLSYTTVAGNTYKGMNLLANSWMAPIRVKDFEIADFHNADATVYVYNTGSYTDWHTNGDGNDGLNETTTAGQYVSLPVSAVGAWEISKFKEIPPMQGFFVKATASDATLTMDFSKLVYSGETLTNKPQRAPQQLRTPFCISVSGAHLADELYILPDEEYTRGFDNGYDAHKMEGDERAPMLALRHNGEDFAIAAVPTADSSLLVFRGGEDTDYTLHFSGVPAGMELVDLYTGAIVALDEQTTYSFSASNEASERFLIRKAQMPGVTTGMEEMNGTDGVRQVYDALGRRIDHTVCPPGVYIVNTQTATGRIATKVIY